MLISITGKSGSGKTFLANKLAKEFDADLICFDEISHNVLNDENVIKTILSKFGENIATNGKINRKLLGNIVFNDKTKLDFLNNLCQNKMEQIIDKKIANSQKSVIILDYSLLPKMKYWKQSNIKILTKASDQTRLNRISKRDGIKKDYFILRDKASLAYDNYDYDIIVESDNEINYISLTQKIKEILC